MNKKLFILTASLFSLGLPVVSFAVLPIEGEITDFSVLICSILKWIWPGFIGLSIIVFMVAGLLLLTSNGEPDKVKRGKLFVVWGVIGVIAAIVGFSAVCIVEKALTGNNTSGICSWACYTSTTGGGTGGGATGAAGGAAGGGTGGSGTSGGATGAAGGAAGGN